MFIALIAHIADLAFHFIPLLLANYLVLLVVLIATYVLAMSAINVWISFIPLAICAILAQ